MSNKIYLVSVSYLIPVVAESEIDAVQLVMQDDSDEECSIVVDEAQQALDALNDPEAGDPFHVSTAAVCVVREVTAADLADEPELAAVCPWGDDDLVTIEERLLGTEEVEDEE